MTDRLLPQELVNKAREVVEANRAAERKVAVAESCTGGLVCAALTEIAGSSDVFEAGYVTYSNASKIDDLGVSEEVVETFGAVSVATACATIPSPRPVKPSPSVVVALMLTCSTLSPAISAMRKRIAAR